MARRVALTLARLALAVGLPCAAGFGQSITTTFVSNGETLVGGAHFYDAVATCDLLIQSFDVNTSLAPGATVSIEVWITPGTYVGNTGNQAAWTLVAKGQGQSAGLDNPSAIDTTDFVLSAGSHGVAILYVDAPGRRTAGNGSNQHYANAEIQLDLGAVMNVPWTGVVFTPRVWNGTIHYSLAASSVAYCTAKQTSCGTTPHVFSKGAASASATSGFVIAASGARASKLGLLLYTDQGRKIPAAPFGQGGYLCLASPLRRGPAVPATGGTAGACDAHFVLDMNTFAAGLAGGHPQPFLSIPGTLVDCQWWGRDTSAHGAFLSDALEYRICP